MEDGVGDGDQAERVAVDGCGSFCHVGAPAWWEDSAGRCPRSGR